MFYVYFFLQLAGIIILSPFRWSINFIIRQLWEPIQFDISELKHKPAKNLKEYFNETHQKLLSSLDSIRKKGDSAKFVSLWWVATKDPKVYELLKSYVKNGKFYRKPGIKAKKAFSGDMMAGYLYALTNMWFCRQFDNDEEFKQEVIKALKNSLFEKPYLQLKSYSETNDRGYLLRFFFMNAGHFLPILTLLQVLHRLENKSSYKLIYWIIFPIALMDIIINPTFAIRYKNYRYMQWYYVHSNFLYYQSLYMLTGNFIYKYALKFIHERFWFNPEFAAFMEVFDIPYLHLTDYTHQSKEENQKAEKIFTKRKVKNLKNILRRKPAEYEEYTQILPPRARKNDYQWEKAMDWNEWKETPLSGIDFLHIYHLLERNGWKL